ncbi:MAG TPA: efflux RND transporter permease subunit [Candidatus Thiothrix moscowensis]|uniref:efflux RND transporter permease subunit n=1 Tax=unclassified Thiothrix TaxID=2636184 RepID=UPI0025D78EE0|nr:MULTISPECIES: efflux RND transporter permease subunit [unclassified Thiothrix]HRJ53837.1 efflux RND transporter permease subunit [Candidatus Thiothrix moscowensis]HRJ93919.1 efflux RND transporter permease subunit [Candidatus Thiothrix moscowensis]
MSETKLGISGAIAKKFLTTEITPLLALVGLLLGLFAVMVTPREEDPQINVTFANVFVPFPGASAEQVESLVSTPAEQVLSEIEGLEHVYSTSMPGMSVLTVQYKVGEDRTAALVRLYNKIASNQDWLPRNLGVGTPLVKPKGIDDVPIVALTLWTEDDKRGAYELNQVAHAIEAELKRVPDSRDIYTIGGPQQVVHVLLDAEKLAGHGISLSDLRNALQASNSARDAVSLVNNNEEIQVQAGTFLMDAAEVGELMVGVFDGKPVFLNDVAEVKRTADTPEAYVSFGTGAGAEHKALPNGIRAPAVTIAVAKQPGTNAVDIANNVIDRFEKLRGTFVPDGINVTVTRNYGETAQAKSEKLISKLIIETIAVILLIWLALGWREALIVGAAVVITLAVTLFASWAYGFTLNRVSLFALIFSIGILVDDAIVVVENIHRHMQQGGKKLLEVIPLAVDEVGGPTILATFTVIAALLPMAFVSGLMGPYMSPIPINASMGMLVSLAVAYVVTPWMTGKMLAKVDFSHHHEDNSKLHGFFSRIMSPFLDDQQGGKRRTTLFVVITLLIVLSVSLAGFKLVVLKMLPFDNKSDFQVILDMPEGTSLEQTSRVLNEMADYLGKIEEVTDYQIYAGTAAPINFNGLVRQYYLREGSNVGDIQVNLTDAHGRNRQSHAIALEVRPHLQAIAQKYHANVKVVEVPPGPPVMSPIVAEVYGLDYAGQIEVAKQIRGIFQQTDDIVDIDDSVEYPQKRLVVQVDRSKAALLGVSQDAIASAVDTVLRGEDVVFLHGKGIKYAVPIRVEFPVALKDKMDSVLAVRVRSQSGELVPMSELVTVQETTREHSIYHKDLLPVVYVTGDMAGATDSPLYGMFGIFSGIKDLSVYGNDIKQHFIAQPDDPYLYGMKWDGEWQVTYETFRDMGIAYAVGMILIYLLIVAQFRSYMVPLVIMSPIPLTIIGVMPGHALLGAQFTATSMIGMIALAGIIVRNSILLVDFINEQVRGGMALKEAVINSSAVRAKPIALTALAAMVGAFFIIDDPIFGGLAVSLIFGILVSTVLTLVLIPLMYYLYARNRLALITAA